MGLGGERHGLARLPGEPRAVGLGLEAIDLHGPVERQRDFLEEIALHPAAPAAQPELRVRGPRVAEPAPALVGPEGLVAVAARLDEGEELGVRHQPPRGAERGEGHFVDAILVVPAVGLVAGRLAEPHGHGRHRQPLVQRRRAVGRAGPPQPPLLGREVGPVPQFRERHLPHDHARRLQVDPFVLDSHEDHPGGRVGADREVERHPLDEGVDEPAQLVAIRAHGPHRRPVVVGRVEVVPRHLVDADGEHRLEPGIDPLGNQAAGDQLVDVEHGRVAEVEDQRVPERLVALVVRRVVADQGEQAVVQLARGVEVAADLRPLGLRVGPREERGLRGHERRRREGPVADDGRDGGRGAGIHGSSLPAAAGKISPTVPRATSPSTSRSGIGAAAARSPPTTAPRWQLSPPERALAATPPATSPA